MPTPHYIFSTIFRQTIDTTITTLPVILPTPVLSLVHSTIIEVKFSPNWIELQQSFESDEHHSRILGQYESDQLNGNEVTLTTSIKPTNQVNLTSMEAVGQLIRQAIIFAWKLFPNSPGVIALEILSDSNGRIWWTAARHAKHYSASNPCLSQERLQDIIDLYPIILKVIIDYYRAIGKDIEEHTFPPAGLQIRNRLTKALRWLDAGLTSKEFDVRYVCFSVALEAIITAEKPGGATKRFIQRVNYLLNKAGVISSACLLGDIYDLRSRLLHGDMAAQFKSSANNLLESLHYILGSVIKYILRNPTSLAVFSSNKPPKESIEEVRQYFSTS